MRREELKVNIDQELQMAEESRQKGNEGRARVCARRAAGIAIGFYFEVLTKASAPKSAYSLLQWLSEQGQNDLEIRRAAQRLTVRVSPDHTLPHPEDPIADARLIIDALNHDRSSNPSHST
jgi:hypothetical protein